MKTKQLTTILLMVIGTAALVAACNLDGGSNGGKINPTVTWPENLSMTYGPATTLSQISLTGISNPGTQGTFEWVSPDSHVGNAGTNAMNMRFIPTDTTTYKTVTNQVNIRVDKALYTPNWDRIEISAHSSNTWNQVFGLAPLINEYGRYHIDTYIWFLNKDDRYNYRHSFIILGTDRVDKSSPSEAYDDKRYVSVFFTFTNPNYYASPNNNIVRVLYSSVNTLRWNFY